MHVSCRGQILEIEDRAISLSPFLSTMIRTEHTVAKDSNGYPTIDVQPAVMRQYIRYLHGQPFMMHKNVEDLISFMGHGERGRKPLGLWVAELYDEWCRHHFEKRYLWKESVAGLFSLTTGTSYPEKDGLYIIGRAAYGYRGRHRCNAYAQDDRALLTDQLRCTTKSYEDPSYHHDDRFYLEPVSHNIVERKVWRSINDIAFNHPASEGMVLSLTDGIVYTTHVCNWKIQNDLQRWMYDAWTSLRTWHRFHTVIDPNVYYHPIGCQEGTMEYYSPAALCGYWDME